MKERVLHKNVIKNVISKVLVVPFLELMKHNETKVNELYRTGTIGCEGHQADATMQQYS